jgi:outer membrane protein
MRRHPPKHLAILAMTPLAFTLCAANAHADQEEDKPARDWDISVGAGVASMPKYPGSDSQKTRALPLISVQYGRFFLGGDTAGTGAGAGGLGVNLYEDAHWRFGAVASFGAFKARKEADDPRLRGLGDIDSTARAGGFASYTQGWLTASASVSTDIGGNHQGTLANFGLTARYRPTDQLTLSAGPNLIWSSGSYMQTFFGIDEEQSLRSGRAQYTAGAGVSSIGFGVGANYRFDRHWSLGVRASTAQLQGDAKDSPITQDKTQNTIAVFAAYHF